MRVFENLQDLYERVAQVEAKQQAADRQVATMTPEQATQMAAFDKWFPWMPKGVMYSLARAGQTALGNPLIEQVALRALEAQQKSAMGLGQVGDPVGESDQPSTEQKKGGWFSKVTHAAGTGLGWASGYTPVKMGAEAAVSRGNPVGRFVRDNPVTNEALEPLARHTLTGQNPLPRGVRMFARTAGAIGDTPRQIVQGGYRSVSADIQQEGFGGFAQNWDLRHPSRLPNLYGKIATDTAAQTELGQLVISSEHGKTDAGSGFFIGGRAKERQHEAEQRFGTILYPDGSRHARTIGRDLAGIGGWLEPGSDAYTAVSGGADFAVAIGADKIAHSTTVEAKANRTFRTVGPGSLAIKAAEEGRTMTPLENMIDALGGIAAPGKRLTVSPEQVESFLAGKRGQWMIDKLVETKSLRTLDRLTGGKLKPEVLLALADETDPDNMRNLARNVFTTGHVKGTPTTRWSQYGFSFKEEAPPPIRRLNQRLYKSGQEARQLRSGRASMTQMIREMDYLGLPEDVQEPFLRKLASAPDLGIVDPDIANKAAASYRRTVFGEFEDHMKGELAKRVGMDDKGTAKIRKLLQREDDRLAHETNYSVLKGKPDSYFGVRTLDGELPLAPAKFEHGPLSVRSKRNALGETEDQVLLEQDLEDMGLSTRIESPGVESMYDPIKAARRGFDFGDDPHASDLVNRLRAVMYKHADDLPDELRAPLKGYVEGTYHHTSTHTLEDAGQVLETMGPGYHREVDDLLKAFGVPDTVTVYRGNRVSEAGKWASGEPDNFLDQLEAKGLLRHWGGEPRLVEPIPVDTGVDVIEASTVSELQSLLDDGANLTPTFVAEHSIVMSGGNAPRGEYVNASLLRSRAERFGAVQEMQVPRSAILGIASPGEAEVIFRADAVNTPYQRLGQVLQQPDIPTPLDINELQREYMPAPDWRQVKHQMGAFKKLYDNGLDIPVASMRKVQSAWKGSVITRPALFLRVVGEIQIAMTLRGASSWLTHPVDTMAYVLGDSKVPETLAEMGKGATDVRGLRFAGHEDDAGKWVKAQERWQGLENESTFYNPPTPEFVSEHFPIAKKSVDPEDFWFGMSDEMRTLSTGPFHSMVVATLLQGGSVDDAVNFAWKSMEDERKLLAFHFAKTPQAAEIMTLEGTNDYIRNKIVPRVMQATGNGNPELLQSLKSGRLGDVPYNIKGEINPELDNALKRFSDILPDEMRTPRQLHTKASRSTSEVLKAVHGGLLDAIFSNRERTLNRSPSFRQFYFKNAIEDARALNPDDAAQFVANLEKAGMKKSDLRRAKYQAERAVENPLSLRELDDLAWDQATDDMQFFQEDLIDKKRWVEAVSIVSPFAHVLSESMTRWAKILSSPAAVAKLERPLNAAKDPELGDVLGLNQDETDPERRGLRYKDVNGEERVAVPLSGNMMGLLGVPVPLHGRLQGYNMIGDFTPGVGPFVSLPAATFFEKFDNPRYDALRDWIFPQGTPRGGVIERNVLGSLPTWLRNSVQGETSQETINAMYYLASTGKYNIQGEDATEEEINRFIGDSKQTARLVKVANAFASAFLPSAPSPEWPIVDQNGNRIPMLTVANDLQKMREDDPRNATMNMLAKYGDNVFLMLVGKSVAVSPGVLPATKDAEKWIRTEGKGLQGSYKDTYGFFAPQPDKSGDKDRNDFDFDVYRRLLENGDRKLTNPDDVPFIANDMVAKARYYALRAKLTNPSSPQSAALLRDFRAQLEKEYPGYEPSGSVPGTLNKASPETMIKELITAKDDPKLANHEAMPALKQYLDFRDKLNAAAPKGRGLNWWTGSSRDGAGARALAAQFGDQLAQENPAFAGMWEGALRREFEAGLAVDDAANAVGG